MIVGNFIIRNSGELTCVRLFDDFIFNNFSPNDCHLAGISIAVDFKEALNLNDPISSFLRLNLLMSVVLSFCES